MDPALATHPIPHGHPSASFQHHYGTRIRQNSVIKPSARLRQPADSPAPPRRIRPALPVPKPGQPSPALPPDSGIPDFPPPHVMLHVEDSSSKVFLAIGRSFLSVDNRAMTIKDLAEMTMKFGLVCQNASAAGQAITTYIRNHMHRCDTQQDYPLLSRHVLSGTPSDDELVSALHSRSGGAHCALAPGDNRVTNFRRGTMVWYLSKAAGAPCPFARAGIRLCEYTENGKVGVSAGPRERKRERDRVRRQEQCGQKRKRLARACADGGKTDSDSGSDAEKRPPKVKLTLRLKPSPSSIASSSPLSTPAPEPIPREIIDVSDDSNSDDDSMSVDSESSSDEDEGDESMRDSPSSEMPYLSPPVDSPIAYRRSPSVPFSVASPPPDSEDDFDYGNSISVFRRYPSMPLRGAPWDDDDDDMDWDEADEDEEELELGGSSLPRIASSSHFDDGAFVKQEPCDDMRRVLDEWEHLDNGFDSMKVMEVVTQAAAGLEVSSNMVKVEESDHWEYDSHDTPSPTPFDLLGDDETYHVPLKEEAHTPSLIMGYSSTFSPDDDGLICGSPLTPLSVVSPISEIGEMRWATMRRPSELMWKDAELLGPDSIPPHELEEGDWDNKKSRSQTLDPAPSIRAVSEAPSDMSPFPDTPSAESDDTQDEVPPTPPTFTSPLPLWRPSQPMLSSSRADVGSRPSPSLEQKGVQTDVVVVDTCEPCSPAVTATQVEGITVYQMTVEASRLLRRIDTDFVNLGLIAKYLSVPTPPAASIPNAMHVTQGSSIACGTWVPLPEAQAFVKEHRAADSCLDTFLSDLLFERFPQALQDFHRSNARGRLLNQFGPHFASTQDAKEAKRLLRRREVPLREASTPWERGMVSYWDVEDHLLSVHPSLTLTDLSLPMKSEDKAVVETPLSPTEQEMFQTLCHLSDWENSPPTTAVPIADDCAQDTTAEVDADVRKEAAADTVVVQRSCSRDRPLRRSKRVANAMARSRTRSSKRGSRSSLS